MFPTRLRAFPANDVGVHRHARSGAAIGQPTVGYVSRIPPPRREGVTAGSRLS